MRRTPWKSPPSRSISYKVTNQQYLEFIAAGGYEKRAFWNDDDWDWKVERGISHPLFWKTKRRPVVVANDVR